MTQFQIEGGGMVQGVAKLIMTFSTFFGPKNLIMPIELKKMELIHYNFDEYMICFICCGNKSLKLLNCFCHLITALL